MIAVMIVAMMVSLPLREGQSVRVPHGGHWRSAIVLDAPDESHLSPWVAVRVGRQSGYELVPREAVKAVKVRRRCRLRALWAVPTALILRATVLDRSGQWYSEPRWKR